MLRLLMPPVERCSRANNGLMLPASSQSLPFCGDDELSPHADVIGRRTDEDVELDRFDAEALALDVVEGELRNRQREVYLPGLAGLQIDALEGPQAFDRLDDRAVHLVGVELRDLCAGAVSGVLDAEGDFDLTARPN